LVAVALLFWIGRLGSYTSLSEWDPDRKVLKGVVLRGGAAQGVGGCIPPPETFQESDLIGVWGPAYGTSGNTILILKANGTYKQIYNNPDIGYYYESDWQRWWVEDRESGTPNVHLVGMRLCDYSIKECQREGGGAAGPWLDFCEGRVVEMQGEVILLVVGAPSNLKNAPPRGIFLDYPLGDPDSISGTFQLQE